MEPRPNDIALEKIRKTVSEQSLERFKLIVERKLQLGNFGRLAVFDDGNIGHLSAGVVESWVEQLTGGGGTYTLTAYAPDDRMIEVLQLSFPAGTPVERVDVAIIKRPDWKGPRSMLFPAMVARSEASVLSVSGALQPGLTGAPANGGGRGPGREGVFHPEEEARWRRLQARELELDAKLASVNELEKRAQARERELQLEQMETKHQKEMAALEARITAIGQAAQTSAPKMGVIDILAAVKPYVEMLMDSMKTSRAETNEVLKTLSAKLSEKPDVPPMIRELVEEIKKDKQGSPQLKMMQEFASATLNLLRQQRELMGDNSPSMPESIMAIREVAAGIAALLEAAKKPGTAAPAGDGAKKSKTFENLVSMIEKKAPVADVVDTLLDAMEKDAEFQAEMEKVQGNIVALFQTRLEATVQKDPSYAQYLADLLTEFQGALQEMTRGQAQPEVVDRVPPGAKPVTPAPAKPDAPAPPAKA